jgi:hypothetical protein
VRASQLSSAVAFVQGLASQVRLRTVTRGMVAIFTSPAQQNRAREARTGGLPKRDLIGAAMCSHLLLASEPNRAVHVCRLGSTCTCLRWDYPSCTPEIPQNRSVTLPGNDIDCVTARPTSTISYFNVLLPTTLSSLIVIFKTYNHEKSHSNYQM